MATVTPKQRRRGKKERELVARALSLAQHVSLFSSTDLWMSFDREADVLYISLRRPQQANDTIELDGGGVLVHYRDDELVGITVLGASTR